MEFPVNIAAHAKGTTPALQGTFGRVNVLLGENGSGKSRLLLQLYRDAKSIFGQDFQPVRIEGGRAIEIPMNVGLEHNPHIFSKVTQSIEEYLTTRSSSLENRIKTTFLVLRALEDSEKRAHSDAVVAWGHGDHSQQVPQRPPPPFERFVSMFQSVFPALKVEVTPSNQLFINRNGDQYPANNLSDGEKQVFLLLADIAILERGKTLFLIDEPELNLHPSLAVSLWQTLEQLHPESAFIYATHSLSFALRSAVDAVWSIPHGQIRLASNDLQNVNLRPFLGAIGGIVKSNICLFVEGEEESFDRAFYAWLLGRQDIDVVAVGSSAEVIAAARRRSVWGQIAPQINVAGIVDGDYGHLRDLAGINNVVQLPVREVESLLCEPSIAMALQGKLKNTGRQITASDIAARLAAVANLDQLRTIAQRVFAEAKIDLAVSLERKTVGAIKTASDLRSAILEEAVKEGEKAQVVLNQEKLGKLFDQVEEECRAAIVSADAEAMLRLFDGKRALSEISKLAGCPTGAGMLSAVVEHFEPAQFPKLTQLKASILTALRI